MTMGPALVVLALAERRRLRGTSWVMTFGRVPMFYYISHLYVLHVLGILAALAAGYPWSSFDFRARITGIPAGFGFPLWGVYLMSTVTVAVLYPACHWYREWKSRTSSLIARYI
jgi:hypothetical protein